MLIGIPPILSPDLIKILMEMGHGDEIVIGDGNFPASSFAKRLINCDGHGIPELLDAILPFFPLDYAVDKPIILMAVQNDMNRPPIWDQYYEIVNKNNPSIKEFQHLERFSFYERAKNAYAIVSTSEKARFANTILKKGIVTY
jgi:L-fucose mutarotase